MTTTAQSGYTSGDSESVRPPRPIFSGWSILYAALILAGLAVTVLAAFEEERGGPRVNSTAAGEAALAVVDAMLLELPTLEAAPRLAGAPSLAELGGWTPVIEDLPPLSAPPRRIDGVNITFYDCANQGFCGAMFGGRRVYEGAAACSWNLPIGTRFVIEGDPTYRVYTCEDRGLLADTWVDVFWHRPSDGYAWQSGVGRYGTIEIVE
jgi:hypothetical protein